MGKGKGRGGHAHDRAMAKVAEANLPVSSTESAPKMEQNAPVKQDQKDRKRDIIGVLLSLGPLMISLFISKALWAEACLVPLGYFLSDLTLTYFPWGDKPALNPKRLLPNIGLAVAISVVGWTSYLHDQYRQQQAAATEGDLISPPPSSTLGKPSIPKVEIGTSGVELVALGGKPSGTMIGFNFESALWLTEDKSGIRVSISVRDRGGNLVGEIVNNHWRVYPPFCSDKNYNKQSIEMKDSAGHVVLQLKLVQDAVQIQAEWRDQFGGGRRFVQAPGGAISYYWHNQEEEEKVAPNLIQPMFLYPSSQHWGELAPTKPQ
jgi:hypothetical protein